MATWSARWVIIALGAVVLGLALERLWSVVLPVVLALILTTVLRPPAALLERRLGFPPALSAATVLLVGLGAVAGIGALILPSVVTQVADIATGASDGLSQVEDWARHSSLDITDKQVHAVVEAAQQRLRSSASSLATGVLVGVSAVTSALLTLALTLVLSFFFVKDGRRFLPWLRAVTGPRVGRHLDEVGSRVWDTLGEFIRTQALVGLIDAVLIGLGLVVVGVPLAFSLSILTFFAAFVPIVGAVTVGAVAVLVTLVSNGLTQALVILAVIFAVQQLEGNVLLPWLQGKSLRLHAGVILLAVTLGSSIYGIVGAFLAVPLVAAVAVLLRYWNELVTGSTHTQPPERQALDDAGGDHPTA